MPENPYPLGSWVVHIGRMEIKDNGAGYDNNGNVILIVKSYKGGEYAILKRHSTETEVAMMKDMTAGL